MAVIGWITSRFLEFVFFEMVLKYDIACGFSFIALRSRFDKKTPLKERKMKKNQKKSRFLVQIVIICSL